MISIKELFDWFTSRDRRGVEFGGNLLSFRAIFNDVRNSVENVHSQVHILYSIKLKQHFFIQG